MAASVVIEEFAFAPTACLNAFPLSAALMLLAALLNAAIGRVSSVSPWITALGGVAFSALAIVVLLLEFVFGFEFIDLFFKKAQSVNVVGSLRRPGTTNVRRLLIVSGHHDSAPENTWLRYTGYGIVPLSVLAVAGLLTVVIMHPSAHRRPDGERRHDARRHFRMEADRVSDRARCHLRPLLYARDKERRHRAWRGR